MKILKLITSFSAIIIGFAVLFFAQLGFLKYIRKHNWGMAGGLIVLVYFAFVAFCIVFFVAILCNAISAIRTHNTNKVFSIVIINIIFEVLNLLPLFSLSLTSIILFPFLTATCIISIVYYIKTKNIEKLEHNRTNFLPKN